MKNLRLAMFLFACLSIGSLQYVEAQVYRASQERRMIRRKVRRHNRRVVQRTIRRLPANTRPVIYRRATYYPVGGMYYVKRRGAYVRAFPPRGFRLRVLPATAVALTVRGTAYRYADGLFYQNVDGDEFEVASPPVGAVVESLPDDAEEIDFGGVSAYELNEAIYKAVEDGYEIIDVLEQEEEEN
ncbi:MULTISPECIES: DUF6515 family protein [Flavobacteriaceae]|uniref:DUF6515 family protein n=1 Tax=Flavobacteriaceae TaxID=49546 RepID=UPI0014909B3D|nr:MULTISPECIES: DUF6515 family protein [Allomuricauda]MDC6367068.1 DUF6515 family protein [Muricauda sp. AC10]